MYVCLGQSTRAANCSEHPYNSSNLGCLLRVDPLRCRCKAPGQLEWLNAAHAERLSLVQ